MALPTSAGRDPAGLRNILGNQINPSTEDTLQDVLTNVGTVVLTPSTPTAATVGVTSASILVSNALRKGCYFINTSTAFISLGLGTPAVLYSGITIPPMWFHFMESGKDLVDEEIFAIASAAAANLSIQEYV